MRSLVTSLLAAACVFHLTEGSAAATDARPAVSLSGLPIEFEANQGQHPPAVRYLARTSSYRVALTDDGAMVMPLRSAAPAAPVRMRFEGAAGASLLPQRMSGHRTHYFLGEDRAARYTDIPNFERVLYKAIYPGVDAVFYARDGEIEYDLVLAPRADPRRIALAFDGARRLALDRSGDLLIHTDQGVLVQRKPVVYQERDGRRTPVAASYRITGQRVRFELARYDASRPLTIDPVLSYSTHLGGGSSDAAHAVAVDAAGNAYVAGATASGNWPVAGAYQGSLAGTRDAYIAKLNPQGTGLVYSTYIGGRRSASAAKAIAVDAAGNAYVAGTTNSSTYPTTAGAYSAALAAGGGFVTKLNAAGNALVYSTYLGGADVAALRVDASGNAYVAGRSGGGLPTTPGALQGSYPSAAGSSGFVAKLNPTGTALAYSTFLGGSGADSITALAIDGSGNAYVTGHAQSTNFPIASPYQSTSRGGTDAFVAKLNAGGSALVFSTYLGGSSDDYGKAIAVDAAGKVYVAGESYSIDFPVVSGHAKPARSTQYSVGTITVMSADGAGVAMSTYFGGKACLSDTVTGCVPTSAYNDGATAIAVDPGGQNIYVAGYLSSIQVDLLQDAVQQDRNGEMDAFVLKLSVDPFTQRILNIRYATRLGGAGAEKATAIALDPQGNAYVVGSSTATNFPTTKGAYRIANAGGEDVFVAKLSTLGRPLTLQGACYVDGIRLWTDGALDATGTVTFYDGASVLGSAPVVNGRALYSGPPALGVHKLTAVRSGEPTPSQAIYCRYE